jgi:hypothetical protein
MLGFRATENKTSNVALLLVFGIISFLTAVASCVSRELVVLAAISSIVDSFLNNDSLRDCLVFCGSSGTR